VLRCCYLWVEQKKVLDLEVISFSEDTQYCVFQQTEIDQSQRMSQPLERILYWTCFSDLDLWGANLGQTKNQNTQQTP